MDLLTDRKSNAVYEYTDLNRVEAAVKSISTMFPQLGIDADIATKTDWGLPGEFTVESYPVESQMIRYLSNVQKIKQLFPNTIKLPTTMENLTWVGANNIEKVLQIAFERIDGIQKSYKFSGELYAGEE